MNLLVFVEAAEAVDELRVRDVAAVVGVTASNSHNYKGHNCIGHNYMGRNYVGHNYIGHKYMCHNYIRRIDMGLKKLPCPRQSQLVNDSLILAKQHILGTR